MPKNFQLNSNTKPGVCDARRCGKAFAHHMMGGVKLCYRHRKELEDGELEEIYNGETAKAAGEDTGEDTKETAIKKYIEPIENEVAENIIDLDALIINSQEMAEMAGAALTEIHEKLKAIEKKEKTVTAPLHEAKTALHALFRPTKDGLGECKKLLKAKLGDWAELQASRRLTALAVGDTETALSIPADSSVPAVQTSYFWTFEVTVIEAVPREFLTIDADAVNMLIKNSDPETLEIPGIRVFQDKRISMARGKK